METWKDIKGYEGFYEVSTCGVVRSKERVVVLKDKSGKDRPCIYKSKILKPCKRTYKSHTNTMHRLQVVLSKDGKTRSYDVHRLVAETFIENPNNYNTVNHIDGNTENNCVNNLEWLPLADNIRHAFKNNLIHTMKPIAMIEPKTGKIVKVYAGEAEACRRNGLKQGKIRKAMQKGWKCRGYNWRYITENDTDYTIEEWIG